MSARWFPLLVVIAFVIAFVIAVGAPRAQAQSPSQQAQALFDDGQRQMKAGKFAEACALFERSQKLEPAVTTQLNLADCREQNHQLATAWSAFHEADRMAQAIGDARLARVAQSHARKLEPRLSRLTISVPADHQVHGLEVLRGAERVPSNVWNHAVTVDGGTYTITARADGFGSWSVAMVIKDEADAQTVEIPKLISEKPVVVDPVPPPPPPTPGPEPAGPPLPGPEPGGAPPAVPSGGDQHSYKLPIAVGAGALVLGGVALAFNLSGDHVYDQAKRATIQSERDALYDKANTRRYAAEGFGIAAAGCAGVAIFLAIRAHGQADPEATTVTPVATSQVAGIAIAGRW